ncbi:MAG: acyltransferase [Proteobacteria bacterium]|nr:MAG: acyltransferase [Pseudomonadota bacterium]
MEKFVDEKNNISIQAESIKIHPNVSFGKNIQVSLRGSFEIGQYSRLGGNAVIKGNSVRIGKHFYNSSGLNIGGGGFQHPDAHFTIGDRCTIHNNFINVCEPVHIGDDVGLSPDTSILTHGYWLSVLEGYPRLSSGVKIGNGVIVGYRSLIMMGVSIADNCVVGAGSTVTKTLSRKGIYAGVPAKFIREIDIPNPEQKLALMEDMLKEYAAMAKYHGINPKVEMQYPFIRVNEFRINVETFDYEGSEDAETDDFRDFIRKWGIRIYTPRQFKSVF